MGGPCDATMTAETEQEMIAAGMKHVEEAHPEMVADIKGMSPEALEKWNSEFHAKWEAIPEDEADEAPEVSDDEEEAA